MIARFQYLTQDLPTISHPELAEIACKNGVKWLQLRTKNLAYEDWLYAARSVKEICDAFQCTLIINDNVSIAQEINAHGVHLGLDDMPPQKARQILGSQAIIGGTANSFEDVLRQANNGCNYIGLGPINYTETKKNTQPQIGIPLLQQMIQMACLRKIQVPIIAIGGIKLVDVETILQTGVHGIAVSSGVNLSPIREIILQHFLEKIKTIPDGQTSNC